MSGSTTTSSDLEQRRQQVELNKPLYVGMAVLDLSKWLMYDFLLQPHEGELIADWQLSIMACMASKSF